HALRDAVRLVFQFLDGLEDAAPDIVADRLVPVEHARHGADGDMSRQGNVANGWAVAHIIPSRDQDDLAEEVARLHQRLGLAELRQREGAHLGLLQLAVGHVDHAAPDVFLGVAVRAADLHLALPDEADIDLRIEARGRTAGEQFAVRFQRTDRRLPGVAAREVHADVDALLAAEAPGL